MRILRGGTLIDGTGAPPVRDATITLRDDRIESVATGAGSWPADAEILDITGRTVLPGLIDCHDHLAFHSYDLAHRCGLDAGFRIAVEEGLIRGPRLLTAVAIVSPIGGIGDRVSPSGHECVVPPDPALPHGVANGVEEARTIVRTMVRAGADVIKCATTGGASSRAGHGPKDGAFDLDEMRALVDESHALGRKVMCHALGGRGLRIALEAGVDSIEHGCYLDEEPELIAMMAERGVFLVPTLTVYEYHRESRARHVRERSRALHVHHVESIHRALEASVRVVAGTDAGGHGHPPNAAELAHLVAAGLTSMQAIQSATSLAAACLGLEREIGTVEKGKRADLIVVDGDPLTDLRILQDPQRIQLVLKDGVTEVERG